ncbi:MAG: hypothetical protein H7Y32_04985, partial [Chloroflexales bacterium]|nr:hypothetical protein [Chloroflexales bacterium]
MAPAGLLALLGSVVILTLLLLCRPHPAVAARAAAPPAQSGNATAIITVTTTSDVVNGALSSIPALLAQPGPDGVSLREALLVGNDAPITTTVRVTFAIAGCATECLILPTTPLPTLARGALTIDGATQLRPDGRPRIILDGYDLFDPPDGMIGLLITSADNRVLSIGIRNFFDRALAIRGSTAANNLVAGCTLGSDGESVPLLSSQIGVELSGGAHDNQIGGSTAAEGNTISGSHLSNVAISGAQTSANVVAGNLIGTTRAGTLPLSSDAGTTPRGVDVSGGARNNQIGGFTAGAGNTISGNATGVRLQGARDTILSANIIGLDRIGDAPLPNVDYGVLVVGGSRGTLIGGTLPGSRNVISSNGTRPGPLTAYGQGVAIQESGTTDTRVQGNVIGLDSSATQPRGNLRQGVLVADEAADTLIGGEAAGAGNLIA